MKKRNIIIISFILILVLAISVSAAPRWKKQSYTYNISLTGNAEHPNRDYNLTFDYSKFLGWDGFDENNITLCWYHWKTGKYHKFQRQNWWSFGNAADSVYVDTTNNFMRITVRKWFDHPWILTICQIDQPCQGENDPGNGHCSNSAKLPDVTEFLDGNETIDFSQYSSYNQIDDLVLSHADGSKIVWDTTVDSDDKNYTAAVELDASQGFVQSLTNMLDMTHAGPAEVTMKGVDCSNPVIYYSPDSNVTDADQVRAGNIICDENSDPKCTILSCEDNTVVFKVDHFSSYAYGANANLAIYDENEGSTYSCNTPITFYANYTTTDDNHIASASCSISFNDGNGWQAMTDNGNNYEYTKNDGFAVGTTEYTWNVSCVKTGYNQLETTDTLETGVCSGETPAIPEFTTVGIILAIVIIVFGFYSIKLRK